MDWLSKVDWAELFVLKQSVLEIFIRGTIMYLSIFLLLRGVLRRQVGMIEIPDILMIVLLADAAQNGMTGDYRSVTAGVLTVGVIAFWNVALDWLAYRWAPLRRLVTPAPIPLVANGRIVHRHMRREGITEEDLWSRLRAHGIDDLRHIKAAYLEANGDISVIENHPHVRPQPGKPRL